MKRWKMSSRASQRNFVKHSRPHPRNNQPLGVNYAQRGGIRM